MLDNKNRYRTTDSGEAQRNPRKDLMVRLRAEFGMGHFVETGTHHGETTYWASQLFDRVYTVEGQKALYDQTVAELGDTPNIEFIFGDSREALKSIVAGIPGPAIFWLDAHWMGADTTFGKNNECPVPEPGGASLRRRRKNIAEREIARL